MAKLDDPLYSKRGAELGSPGDNVVLSLEGLGAAVPRGCASGALVGRVALSGICAPERAPALFRHCKRQLVL